METTFIPYSKAQSIIKKYTGNFSIETKNLEEAIGSYLAEDLIADRDFPPFNRVTMDGIAILFDSFKNGQKSFTIAGVAAAGSAQQYLKNAEHCIEVMTGAILPKGVDTVIRYEDITIENQQATINVSTVKDQQNVHFKGMDMAQGATIVSKGKKVSSAEITIAATIGKAQLKVRKLPKTIIFSTGNELVPVSETPQPHQIRRSNSYGIQASLKEWGINADLQHLPDDKEKMFTEISSLLDTYDLFIFSGGVSKGKYDYLPEVLEKLHVKKHFHKVQQRPGKPFWFGTTEHKKTIFALPGNPVSSFVCTYVYVKKWLELSLTIPQEKIYVSLKTDITFKPDLVYFLQAKLESDVDGKLIAEPVKGNGSGDFINLVHADGFLMLPQGKNIFKKGEVFEFIRYR